MLNELVNPYAQVQLTIERLKKGIMLVSVDAQGKANIMAASWGFIGFQWGQPVFITPVRPSRYSHSLIEASGEFVISVQPPTMDDDMMFCGGCSGQNIDKWQARGLTPVQIPGFRTPGVAGSLLHYACRVMHKASAEPLSSHTFFFGEIDKVYADIGG
jgi:flavin reductase (DIM6/NTAB) family NADH-FMN oxidoreductase RutF